MFCLEKMTYNIYFVIQVILRDQIIMFLLLKLIVQCKNILFGCRKIFRDYNDRKINFKDRTMPRLKFLGLIAISSTASF